jgi:hypothetical protein
MKREKRIERVVWPRDTYLGPRAVALRLPLNDGGANRLLERGHVAVSENLLRWQGNR